jgi:hypothetical protein
MENQFVVGWGTLALIIAGIAQGKNRSGLPWFLLGVLLGPIALLFLLLSPKLSENHEESHNIEEGAAVGSWRRRFRFTTTSGDF